MPKTRLSFQVSSFENLSKMLKCMAQWKKPIMKTQDVKANIDKTSLHPEGTIIFLQVKEYA